MLSASPSRAQSSLRVPTPNGDVHAFATIGNTAYVGGAFDRIGLYTGGGAALDAQTGELRSGNPGFRVSGVSVFYPGGIVTAAVADGSGGWFIGGDFLSLGGVSRPYLARVDANGNLLPWTPPAPNGSVWSLLLSGSTLYVGGDFTSLGATTRNHLAAVDAGSGSLLGWDPGADNRVDALALAGGTVYAGGSFYTLGGQSRAGIGAADAVTGAVAAWNPNLGPFPPQVNAIAIGPGTAYIGGYFGTVQGVARTNAAAVDLATGMPTAWAPNPNSTVHSLIVSGGSIYAGGEFSSIGGRSRFGVALLNSTNGNASVSWNAACDDYVYQLALNGTTLYVAGAFAALGGQARSRLGAIDAATALATPWTPKVEGPVWAVSPSGSGVFVGGQFQRPNSVTRRGLAAIDLVTRTVTPWDPNVNGTVYALATDGTTLYAGGSFALAGGLSRRGLVAYTPPLSTPTSFDPQADQGTVYSPVVYALALEPDVLRVGGYIHKLGGQDRSNAGAVSTSTALATAWAPEPNSTVLSILPSSGGVYLAGAFSAVGGTPRSILAQVDPVTGAATSWVPPAFFGGYSAGGTLIPASLRSLAEKSDALYVGGSFSAVGGQGRANLAALDASGAVLPWTVPGIWYAGTIGTTALDADGPRVFAGSSGVPGVNGIRALDPSTGAVAPWPPAVSAVNAVKYAGGYVLIGGEFLDVGPDPSPNLAVLVDPAALDVPSRTGTSGTLSLAPLLPNPARAAVSVEWTLARRAVVSVSLLDLSGRRVRTIVPRGELDAGRHVRRFDASGLAPGLYVLDAIAGDARASRKLVVVR